MEFIHGHSIHGRIQPRPKACDKLHNGPLLLRHRRLEPSPHSGPVSLGPENRGQAPDSALDSLVAPIFPGQWPWDLWDGLRGRRNSEFRGVKRRLSAIFIPTWVPT